MKLGFIIKILLVLAILVAIFGAGTVKGWLSNGANKVVDQVEYGVNKAKDSEVFQDGINKAKNAATGAAKDAIGNLFK